MIATSLRDNWSNQNLCKAARISWFGKSTRSIPKVSGDVKPQPESPAAKSQGDSIGRCLEPGCRCGRYQAHKWRTAMQMCIECGHSPASHSALASKEQPKQPPTPTHRSTDSITKLLISPATPTHQEPVDTFSRLRNGDGSLNLDLSVALVPQLKHLGVDVNQATAAINSLIRQMLQGAPSVIDPPPSSERLRTTSEVTAIVNRAEALAASVVAAPSPSHSPDPPALERRPSGIRAPPPPPKPEAGEESEDLSVDRRGSTIVSLDSRGSTVVISPGSSLDASASLPEYASSSLLLTPERKPSTEEKEDKPLTPMVLELQREESENSLSASPSSGGREERSVSRREKVIREFISTEESYANSLNLLLNTFIIPLKIQAHEPSFGITPEQLRGLLSNLENVVAFHSEFSKKIKGDQSLTQVLLESPIEEMYLEYMTNYQGMITTLDALRKQRKFLSFQDTMVEDMNKHTNGTALDLVSYLIMPVQRVPRYIMLLKELIKSTDPTHPEFAALADCLLKMELAASMCNEGMRKRETELQLEELQNRIGPDVDLAGRTLIREDVVQLKGGGVLGGDSKMRILLFMDLLCWTSESYKFKGKKGLAAAQFMMDTGEPGERPGIEVSTNSDCFVFYLQNGEEEQWLADAEAAKLEAKKAREEKMRSKTLKVSRSANTATSDYNAEMQQALSSLKKGGTFGADTKRQPMTRRQLMKGNKSPELTIDPRLLNGEVSSGEPRGSHVISPPKRSLSLTPRTSRSSGGD